MSSKNDSTPVWLITGCSTGLGRALAERVLQHGHRAVVTARNVNQIRDITAAHAKSALTVALDVNDSKQVDDVIARAENALAVLTCLSIMPAMATLRQSKKVTSRKYAICSIPTSFHWLH